MHTVHLIYVPDEYRWLDELTSHGVQYLGEHCEAPTRFEFRDADEWPQMFSVDSYATPEQLDEVVSASGVPASWLRKLSNDGFAEFVADFGRRHPPPEVQHP